MKTIYIIVCLAILLYQASGLLSNAFCSSLCSKTKCNDVTETGCTQCVTGYTLGWFVWQGKCFIATQNQLSNGIKRYEPVGTSGDFVNSQGGNLPVQKFDVNINGVPSTPAGDCTKDSSYSYKYYGDLTKTDVVTFSYSGVVTVSYYWKIRLIYWVMTKDSWDGSSKLTTTFVTDPASTVLVTNIGSNTAANKRICGDNTQDQDYQVIDNEWTYSGLTSLDFSLAITDNTKSNPWGVKQFTVLLRLCHPYCATCTGDDNNMCSVCDDSVYKTMLSGTTCGTTCAKYYGVNSTNLLVCISCAPKCTSCLDSATMCLSCDNGYYLYDDGSGTSITCVLTCISTHYANALVNPKACTKCDSACLTCNQAPKCLTCLITPTMTYLYNNLCYDPCPALTFPDIPSQTCKACYNLCTTCSILTNNCSVCQTTGIYTSFLNGTACVANCGNKYFGDTNSGMGPNVCTLCDPSCLLCSINSTYCSQCAPPNYLYNMTCSTICPTGFFGDNATWSCLDQNTNSVGLVTNLYFTDALKQQLNFDLTFSHALNWTTAELQAFVTISQNDPLLDLANHFNINYTVLSATEFRISIQPKGYIFIYNATFTLTTASNIGRTDYSSTWYPFKLTVYNQTGSETWFLIKAPSMSDKEKAIINGFSKMSDKVSQFSTMPYMQEIKKTGIFAMLLGGAQATSMSCLINSIPSQNSYEGVRLWASFVFFDVPQWQKNSNKSKYVVVPDVNDITKDARRLQQKSEINHLLEQGLLLQQESQFSHNRTLFDSSSMEWRFQRTGHTSFFIFDTYMNIILIVICWALIIIGNKCIKHKKNFNKYMGIFYSFTLKIHQISIFYITLTTLLEWIYFDAASFQRWVSFGLCILFNLYFLGFQLYIYYDMITYPTAQIGNKSYDYFCLRYGSLLKNIRFQQYDANQAWSVKHWFRPYNFHIVSYYTKSVMLISLPLFYGTANAQIYVLLGIQLLQIIRFVVVWPFKSRVRNIIRLCLQIILFTFFITILIQGMMVEVIMINQPSSLENAVNLFYTIGWVGFCMVFIFNIGHLAFVIFDIVIGCKMTNRQLMDQARKNYYMQRLKTYQQQNQDVPLGLVNKWVKFGNLNDRNYDVLPDISLRLECFKIIRTPKGYQIDMKKIFNIFMNIQFNYQDQNNLTASKKLNKRFLLTKALSAPFYNTIHNLYQKYCALVQIQSLTIKTFQKVIQSDLKAGQAVKMDPKEMIQKVQLQLKNGQVNKIKLDQMLQGFPISQEELANV